jgi:hypothetical protein
MRAGELLAIGLLDLHLPSRTAPNVGSRSKPEKLNVSRCFLLYLQKLTYQAY